MHLSILNSSVCAPQVFFILASENIHRMSGVAFISKPSLLLLFRRRTVVPALPWIGRCKGCGKTSSIWGSVESHQATLSVVFAIGWLFV